MNRILKQVEKNAEEQVRFLQKLVQTKSANPFTPETSVPDEPVEKEMAHVLASKLQEIGLEPQFVGQSDQRPNVVATVRSSGSKTLILNGHMDTVNPPTDYTLDPYGGAIIGNRLYGVGALDMKSALSVYIYAIKAILDAGVRPNGTLILMFVVDEEPGGCSRLGTWHVLERGITGDSAIIGYPRYDKIRIGHRGGYRFRIVTLGEAAHTGMRGWEDKKTGRNAILDMMIVAADLEDLEIPPKESPIFGDRKSVLTFPTLIRGGENINSVPAFCEAYGDIRLLPDISRETIRNLLKSQLEKTKTRCQIKYRIDELLYVPAVRISDDEEIVEVVRKNARDILGIDPELDVAGPWNEAWMFIERNIPCICGFGCHGNGAHAKDEWVDLDSVVQVTKVYAKSILEYLK